MGTKLSFNAYYQPHVSSVLTPHGAPVTDFSTSITEGAAGPWVYALWDNNNSNAGGVSSKTRTYSGPYTDPGNFTYYSSESYGRVVWVSQPFEQVTISGSINLQTWMYSAGTNHTLRIVVQKIGVDGTATEVINSLCPYAATSTVAQYNWTYTPTPFTINPGEYLLATVFDDDVAGLSASANAGTSFYYGGTASTRNSFIEFTEVLTQYWSPAGNELTLRSTDSDVSGKKRAWADYSWVSNAWSPAGTGTDYVVNTANDPAFPQWTDTAGGSTIEWITPRLQAVTLSGSIEFRKWGKESSANANASIYAKIYKTDTDGNNPVQVGHARMWNEWTTAYSEPHNYNYGVINADIALGERLLIRLYVSSVGKYAQKMVAGYTATIRVNDTTSYASLTRIKFPATLQEFAGSVVRLEPVTVEVSVQADEDTFDQFSHLAVSAPLDAYATSETAHTGAPAPINVLLTGTPLLTGGNAEASLPATPQLFSDPTVFTSSKEVTANFGGEETEPDFTDPSGTGYPEGTFGTTQRMYSDLLDVTDYNHGAPVYYRNPNSMAGKLQIQHPVGPGIPCIATVSATRLVVGWIQSKYWGGNTEARFYVALVDTGNPFQPRIVDRTYHTIQGSDPTYVPSETGSCVNSLYLPDGDVVMTMTVYDGTGTSTKDYGYGEAIPIARVHVNGDNVSFKWCKMVGHPDPTKTSEYFFNLALGYDYDADDIFVMCGISIGTTSARVKWTAHMNADTGAWKSYNYTSVSDSYCQTLMMAFRSGNFYFLNDYAYIKGSVSSGQTTTGWIDMDGGIHNQWYYDQCWHAYDGQYYPIHDQATDTFLIMWQSYQTPGKYLMRMARLGEVDGQLVVIKTYSSKEIVDYFNGYGTTEDNPYNGWHQCEANWYGDNNYYIPLSNPDGTATFVGQGVATDYNSPPQHQGGIQVSYKVGEDDLTKPEGDRYGVSKRWDTPAAHGNWLDMLSYSGTVEDGFYQNWWVTACLLGQGRVGIALSDCWVGGRDTEPYVYGRMFVTIYNPANEPPPLKLSQRDDDKVAGAARIGYQPQNSGAIRAGWVAW